MQLVTTPVRTPQDMKHIGSAVNAMVQDDRQRESVLRAALSAPRTTEDVVTVLKAVDDTFGDDGYETNTAPWALHHRRDANDFRVLGPKVAAVVQDERQRATAFTRVGDSWRSAQDAVDFLQGVDDTFGDDAYETRAIERYVDSPRAGASVARFGRAVAAMVEDERQRAEVLDVAVASRRADADLVDAFQAIDDTFGDDAYEVRAARPVIESARSGADLRTIGRAVAAMLQDERQRFELLGATLRSSATAVDIRDGFQAIDDTFSDDGAELRAAIDWLAQTS